jgi:hypothetical protein
MIQVDCGCFYRVFDSLALFDDWFNSSSAHELIQLTIANGANFSVKFIGK